MDDNLDTASHLSASPLPTPSFALPSFTPLGLLFTIWTAVIVPLFVVKIAIPIITFSPMTYMQSVSANISKGSSIKQQSAAAVSSLSKKGKKKFSSKKGSFGLTSLCSGSTNHANQKRNQDPSDSVPPSVLHSEQIVNHTHECCDADGDVNTNAMATATDQQEIEIRDSGHSIEITSSGSMSLVEPPSQDYQSGLDNNSNAASAKKTVFLIRHAESDENRRLMSFTRSLTTVAKLGFPAKADVMASVELLDVKAQLDSDVSGVGKRQIAQVAHQLVDANFVETSCIQLVAHSPLRRARQTSEGMLGCVSQRGSVLSTTNSADSDLSDAQEDDRNETAESSFTAPNSRQQEEKVVYDDSDEMPLFAGNPCGAGPPQLNPKVALQQIRQMQAQRQRHGPHRTLVEKEYTSMGKKAPTVSRIVELPALMERTPLEWLNPTLLANRIAEFEDWLAAQPESRIAIVGHSQYFKTMLGLTFKFQNCDVWELKFDPNERRRGVQAVLDDGAGTNTIALQETISKSDAATRLKEMQERNIFSKLTIKSPPKSQSGVGEVTQTEASKRNSTTSATPSNETKKGGESSVGTKEKETDVTEVKDLPKGWSDLKMLYRFDPSDKSVAIL